MQLGPIRSFALKALLWLPLSFVLWFAFAPFLVWPALLLAKPVLLGAWGDIFTAASLGGEMHDASGRVLSHAGYLVSLTSVPVQIPAGPGSPGGLGELQPTINPMIYGYALPLFAGLAMATPVSGRRRSVQFALALMLIWLAQAFGILAEGIKVLAFDAGEPGAALAARSGLAPDVIALAYQLAYLILPAVLPVALWIGLNRRFIESLVDRGGNP
ncbi:exosortase H-associated membrane protein [Dokdonella sp.]|uniref:exosortase H-associated membrane protein n=1 Tax=Dokdonella sp. TaxID=2291710 RepID=UPI0031C43E10|nr:hypothetical protein [Dokdonella sp.]